MLCAEVQALMQLIHEEIGNMAYLVRAGMLQDSVEDVYGYILDREGAAPVHSDLVLSSSDADDIEDDAKADSIPQIVLSDTVLGSDMCDHAMLQYLHTPGSRVGSLLSFLWPLCIIAHMDASAFAFVAQVARLTFSWQP